MLHYDYGHQDLDSILALDRQRFYWNAMYRDVIEYGTNCHWCHFEKGHFTGLHTHQGSLVANNSLDL